MGFFEQLKDFLRNEEALKDVACGYYETIVQNTDKLSAIIQDAESHDLEIHYEKDSDGYSYGKLMVYVCDREADHWVVLNYHYEIVLRWDERYWGYCQCTPDDEGYSHVHKCCGVGCDWVAPAVTVSRIEGIASFSFNGYERDLWALQQKWDGEAVDVEKREFEAQISNIDKEIERLLEQKKRLLEGAERKCA